MRSKGLNVQGRLIMQGIVDKLVIVSDGETAEVAKSVKESVGYRGQSAANEAAWVSQEHGFWNLTFEELAYHSMKPIQTCSE
jgi:hypothetical protein